MVTFHLSMQRLCVPSLLRELRSHMPSQKSKTMKQKQCCNKLNKDLKMVHIKKKDEKSLEKKKNEETWLILNSGLLTHETLSKFK